MRKMIMDTSLESTLTKQVEKNHINRETTDDKYRTKSWAPNGCWDEKYLKKLSSIPSINSPEIGTLQHCLYLHHKNDEIKHKLPEFGFLNCHKYVRIVGGQSGQSFGHLAKLNLRVDAV